MRDSWWRWSILAILWAPVAVLKAAFCAVCIFLKLESLALVLQLVHWLYDKVPGSNDSRLHRWWNRQIIHWQIGVNSSIQDQRHIFFLVSSQSMSTLTSPMRLYVSSKVSLSCPQDDPASAFRILFLLSILSDT